MPVIIIPPPSSTTSPGGPVGPVAPGDIDATGTREGQRLEVTGGAWGAGPAKRRVSSIRERAELAPEVGDLCEVVSRGLAGLYVYDGAGWVTVHPFTLCSPRPWVGERSMYQLDHQHPSFRHVQAWFGQSYTAGLRGSPALSVAQPFDNERVNNDSDGLVDLVAGQPPYEVYGGQDAEQPFIAAVNQLSALGGRRDTIVADWAPGGVAIAHFRAAGGAGYASMGARLAAAFGNLGAGRTGVLTFMGGNIGFADMMAALPFEDFLASWHGAVEEMAATADGLGAAPFFPVRGMEQASWEAVADPSPADLVYAPQQLEAALADPRIVLAAPNHQLQINAVDNIHLTAAAYRLLGETWGKALWVVQGLGLRWLPLHAADAVANGSQVHVACFVPSLAYGTHRQGAPLLELDTATVGNGFRAAAMSAVHHGFRYIADVGPAREVTAVEVGERLPGTPYVEVIVTLDGDAAEGSRIGVADRGSSIFAGGPHPGCNLRTNDATVGQGSDLFVNDWMMAGRVTIR